MMLHGLPRWVLDAFGVSLLHSLWQGALIASIIACILAFGPKAAPRTRFVLILGGLVAALLMWVTTLVIAASSAAQPSTHDWAGGTPAIHLPPVATEWLSTAWAVALALASARLGLGLFTVATWRRRGVSALPSTVHSRLVPLLAKAGLAGRVDSKASTQVPGPMVIGAFRPTVYLPVWAIDGLRPTHLDAIMAHELAHVLRRDILLGIVQQLAVLVFLFRPAIVWLSRRLDIEREEACDDAAIALGPSEEDLARALTEVAALRRDHRQQALAMASTGGKLMRRIKRLIRGEPTNPREYTRAMTGATTFALLALVFVGDVSLGGPAERQASAELQAQRNADLQLLADTLGSTELTEADVLQLESNHAAAPSDLRAHSSSSMGSSAGSWRLRTTSPSPDSHAFI